MCWVDETRPRLQGARLTAWELMRDGIPMTLIADNAAGMLMRLGRVDLVLFGADRVAANGDVANKIGSYKLAVLARENGVPCYSVVPTPTIDLSLAHGDLIPIEERDAREVTHVGAEQIAPDGVPVYNPAFDVTPHRYLTGIITEEGHLLSAVWGQLAAGGGGGGERRRVDKVESRQVDKETGCGILVYLFPCLLVPQVTDMSEQSLRMAQPHHLRRRAATWPRCRTRRCSWSSRRRRTTWRRITATTTTT